MFRKREKQEQKLPFEGTLALEVNWPGAEIAEELSSPWEKMADEVMQETHESEAKQSKMVDRQWRIINYYMNDKNPQYLAMKGSENALGLSNYLNLLEQGRITTNDQNEMLLKIKGSMHEKDLGPEWIQARIRFDPWQTSALYVATGINMDCDPQEGVKLVRSTFGEQMERGQDLRTPIGFESLRKDALARLRNTVDQPTFERYEQAMDDLERTIYGKRFDYYQAMCDLTEQAKKAKTESKIVEFTKNHKRQVGDSPVRNAETRPMEFKQEARVAYLMPGEQKELLERAVIDGDPWQQGGLEYKLTPEVLDQAGLEPKYRVNIENAEINLSRLYQDNTGRAMTVAYIPTIEGLKVRSYYLSQSQGVWRYMPDYVRGTNPYSAAHFGKGFSEEQTLLPHEMQNVLAKMLKTGSPKNLTDVNPMFVFCGTAKSYNTLDDYREAKRNGTLRGDFYNEVKREPKSAEFGRLGAQAKLAPESLVMKPEMMPNFQDKRGKYESISTVTGDYETEVFSSMRGDDLWLICRDARGRAWVGALEAKAPITSTGVRSEWNEIGDLSTPLYEYKKQADGYGDEGDVPAKGKYIGMWRNYLSKIPLLREYVAKKSRGEI